MKHFWSGKIAPLALGAAIVGSALGMTSNAAEASDVWIYGSNGEDYYVITESVHGDAAHDWFAKVKTVRNGRLERTTQYRFISVEDYITVNHKENGQWHFDGHTNDNSFAWMLWEKAVVPYM